MGEPQVQLPIIESDGAKELTESNAGREENPNGDANDVPNQPETEVKNQRRHQRWLRIALYAVLVLVGQSASTLLGRQYYQQGGKSRWIGTLVQLVGFPILLPFYCIPASKHSITATNNINHNQKQPSVSMLAFVYASLGLLAALNCYLYSIGLSYLPVSTYSIICSLDLAFNSFFSFFLNSQKFTPYIINSLVLLTISSILLVFETDDSSSSSSSSESSSQISKKKYVIGFISTVGASAGYGLEFSLTQYAFRKVLRNENFRVVLDMLVYHSLVATLATMVGMFGSGDFKGLKAEMEEYKMGKASYVIILSFSAITWQLYTVGYLGLILEVSSLFSNAISVVGFPIVPILAVVIFHEAMQGLKAIPLVLALWGFCSYIYQQYLDEIQPNTKVRKSGDSLRGSPSQDLNE
ncbi:probable purine permease 10 [Neltuma alba]|uniref:probable purine permease 10 n=1 Tax=Neltuma alba TaxID=207710 RepID=UPI0010A397E1|nr:probable purine permease 10 [Prosopis alba]